MEKLYILCVDDQQEVLNALVEDLSFFESSFNIEACDTGEEVLSLMNEIDANGDFVSLIISDQVMPNMTGVELLSAIHQDKRFQGTQKLLLTGLATQEDTIQAINEANINLYVPKPWKKDHLVEKVMTLVTTYILEKGIDYEPLMSMLDQEVLLRKLHQ